MDKEAWWATGHRVTKSWTQLKQRSMHTINTWFFPQMLPFCIKPKIGQNAEKLNFSYKTLIFENLFLTTYFCFVLSILPGFCA